MQADSDFGFVTEIADRTGHDWWVDGKTLYFRPSTPTGTAVRLTVGEDLDSFSVRASALHPGTPTICGWWPTTKQSVTANGATSTAGSTADLVGPYLAAKQLEQSNTTISTADMAGDQKEAETLADRLVDRWTAGAVTAKGSCPADPRIAPGWIGGDRRCRAGVGDLPRHRGRTFLLPPWFRDPFHRRRSTAVQPGRRAVHRAPVELPPGRTGGRNRHHGRQRRRAPPGT